MPIPRYLKEKEAAEVLGVHPMTLARWRSKRLGPPWVHLQSGRSKNPPVRYPEDQLQQWANENAPAPRSRARKRRAA